MQLEIYKVKEKVEEKTYLKLEKSIHGGINVVAVNKDGISIKCGSILEISDYGIHMYCCINNDLGFSVDDKGHLKVTFE